MNRILVIENEPDDFKDIKNNLGDWEIVPDDCADVSYDSLDDVFSFVITQLNKYRDIVAIIIDISLISHDDEMGLELIRKIRSEDREIKNKIIPIFCYSRHDDKKSKALMAGATNFFTKMSIIDDASSRFKFLRQTLRALVFLYLDAMNYAQELDKFDDIMKQLEKNSDENKIVIKAIMQMVNIDDYNALFNTDMDEEKIKSILGDQYIENLKQVKLNKEVKNNLEDQLNDVADIIDKIPGFSPVSGLLKVIRFLLKNFL